MTTKNDIPVIITVQKILKLGIFFNQKTLFYETNQICRRPVPASVA
jgi:hypothetical protein